MADCHFISLLCNQGRPVTQASLLAHIHPALMQTGGREAGTWRKLLWWLQDSWPCPAGEKNG